MRCDADFNFGFLHISFSRALRPFCSDLNIAGGPREGAGGGPSGGGGPGGGGGGIVNLLFCCC